MSLSIFAAAAEAPDRPALISGGRVRTFAQLAGAAARATRWLRAAGVAPGGSEPVALVATNSEASMQMLHALIAAAVPAHLVHPALAAREREAVIRRSGARAVVTEAWTEEVAESGDREVASPPPESAEPADERTLAVVYTSGSTGAPKGVILSRRAFAASAAASAANLGWQPDDRWLLRLPIAHVGGLSILTRCLLARRAVVLPDPRPDGVDTLIQAVERDGATLVSLVPTLLRRLLDREPAWDPPPHLRAVLLGGAAPPADLLERADARAWPVLTTYGMSECCSQVATQRPGSRRAPNAIGAPLPGVEVRIRGGEIQVRGPILFSGYHPPAPPEPFTVDGWFGTGDLGHLDQDGQLHVTGRSDEVIITGGENVDPREVEDALRSVPGIRDACVFPVPDPEWGQRVCAAIVPGSTASPAPSGSASPPDPVEALRGRIAGFKIPRSVMLMERLPLNATGKVDRRAVREAFMRNRQTGG